jgi:hypothetical protein
MKPWACLYEGTPRRKTQRPTTERLLKAFKGIVLYHYRVDEQQVLHAKSPLATSHVEWDSSQITI